VDNPVMAHRAALFSAWSKKLLVRSRRPPNLAQMNSYLSALVGGLLATAVWSLFGAFALRFTARRFTSLTLGYGQAYQTFFSVTAIIVILNLCLLGFLGLVTPPSPESIALLQLVMLPFGFLLQAAAFSERLQVSFARACLMSLIITVFVSVIMTALGLAFYYMLSTKGIGGA
jgi:hypothetical protein